MLTTVKFFWRFLWGCAVGPYRFPNLMDNCYRVKLKRHFQLTSRSNYPFNGCLTAGNEFFKQQQYPEAVRHYTEALRRNPRDPKVISYNFSFTF